MANHHYRGSLVRLSLIFRKPRKYEKLQYVNLPVSEASEYANCISAGGKSSPRGPPVCQE